jgi:hypothetical protein
MVPLIIGYWWSKIVRSSKHLSTEANIHEANIHETNIQEANIHEANIHETTINEASKDEFINEYNIVYDNKHNTNFVSLKQKHQLRNYWRDREAIICEKGIGYLR